MVRFKVIDKRNSLTSQILEEEKRLDRFRDAYLQELASKVILYSPVDTGTYITSHQIKPGRGGSGNFSSSNGKPKGQPYQPFADTGLANLFSDIEALPEVSLDFITISNYSQHAYSVEYEFGDPPYTSVRSEASNIAEKVAQRFKS